MGSITTRGGDHGQTFTLSGERVLKNDPRVMIPGMNDYLITHLSSIKIALGSQDEKWEILTWLQTCFFIISARTSDPYLQTPFQHQITEKELAFLDKLIQDYEPQTAMPNFFIIPGSNLHACLLDQARVLVRKIECKMVEFFRTFPQHKISEATLAFLNRLSDLFYIWARGAEQGQFVPVDYTFVQKFPGEYEKKKKS